MKKIRVFAGVTALVLALGLLAACGQKQEEQVEEEPAQETVETGPVEDERTEDPIEEEPTEEDASIEDEEPVGDADPTEDETGETGSIQVAELTEVNEDGTMTVTLYEGEEDTESLIGEYTDVDFTPFTATEQTQPLELTVDMTLYVVRDGLLEEADISALVEGSMLLLITADDGTQLIVIYEPVAESAAS